MSENPKPPKGTSADRDAKLAQALRANLRRRKAGAHESTAEQKPKSAS